MSPRMPWLMPRNPMTRSTAPATYFVAVPKLPSRVSPNTMPDGHQRPAEDREAEGDSQPSLSLQPAETEDQPGGEDVEREWQRQQKPRQQIHDVAFLPDMP